MQLDNNSIQPIYAQIADWLEDEILAGRLAADGKVYSQYQLAELFNINPATAAKGLNLLADNGIVYKRRGLGMFVAEDGLAIIRQKRREGTIRQLARALAQQARQLGMTQRELDGLLAEAYQAVMEGTENDSGNM